METKMKKSFQGGMKNIVPNLELVFKVCYLVHLLMAFNAYFAGERIMNVTLVLTLFFGGLMGIMRLIRIKDYITFPNIFISTIPNIPITIKKYIHIELFIHFHLLSYLLAIYNCKTWSKRFVYKFTIISFSSINTFHIYII